MRADVCYATWVSICLDFRAWSPSPKLCHNEAAYLAPGRTFTGRHICSRSELGVQYGQAGLTQKAAVLGRAMAVA